jgi:hypothetical protein
MGALGKIAGKVKKETLGVQKVAGKVKGTVKKAVKVAKIAGNVAKAGVKLAAQVYNPVNIARSIKDKGITLPGSKYIGPGNAMNKGKPKDRGDALAYQHDKDYDKLLKGGVKPKDLYTGYSNADKRLLKGSWRAVRDHGDAGALAAAAGMGIKALGAKLGVTKRINDKKYLK